MFGLGFGEMVVIVILAIVVVGPSRLPTLMKTVGGAMRQLRQASRDIRSTVGFDELIDLNGPQPRRPVARARPPQAPIDAAPVAQVDNPSPSPHAAPTSEPGDATAPDDKTTIAGTAGGTPSIDN